MQLGKVSDSHHGEKDGFDTLCQCAVFGPIFFFISEKGNVVQREEESVFGTGDEQATLL